MRYLLVLACASTVFIAATPNKYIDPSCNHDVTVRDAAQPNIAKADFKANLNANALVTVGTNGKPIKAKIVLSSGSAAIDKATVDAAMASTYKPEMSQCKLKVGTYLFHVETSNP